MICAEDIKILDCYEAILKMNILVNCGLLKLQYHKCYLLKIVILDQLIAIYWRYENTELLSI